MLTFTRLAPCSGRYKLVSRFQFLPKLNPLPEDASRVTPLAPEPVPGQPLVQLRVDEAPDAWMRQRGEPEDAWARFQAFRDSPRPRRMVRPGAGRTQELYRLAGEWRWFERCESYDHYIDRIRQKEIDAFVKQKATEVAAEHMGILRDAREFLAIEISRILERCKKNSIDGTLKPAEVFRLMELCMKYDRVYRDQANEIHDIGATNVNVENLSLDETREALALVEKMKMRIAT